MTPCVELGMTDPLSERNINSVERTDVVCIYQRDTLDGIAAAWAVWKKYPLVQLIPRDQGQPPPDIRGRHVVIADYFYDRTTLLDMAGEAKTILFFNHHESTIKEIATLIQDDIIHGILDTDKSACVSVWEMLHTDPVPKLLLHVQDQDLWKFTMKHTRELMMLMSICEYDVRVWDYFVGRCKNQHHFGAMVSSGRDILRAHLKNVKRAALSTIRRFTVGGYQNIPVVNAPQSMAADVLDRVGSNEHFIACYQDTTKAREFYLRSPAGGVDVSLIASQYGGTGRQYAAKFAVEYKDLMLFGLL